MPQQRSKTPHAATRTWHSQISKIFKKNQMEITELKKKRNMWNSKIHWLNSVAQGRWEDRVTEAADLKVRRIYSNLSRLTFQKNLSDLHDGEKTDPMQAGLTVMTILQYVQIVSHYATHLKLTQWHRYIMYQWKRYEEFYRPSPVNL